MVMLTDYLLSLRELDFFKQRVLGSQLDRATFSEFCVEIAGLSGVISISSYPSRSIKGISELFLI